MVYKKQQPVAKEGAQLEHLVSNQNLFYLVNLKVSLKGHTDVSLLTVFEYQATN